MKKLLIAFISLGLVTVLFVACGAGLHAVQRQPFIVEEAPPQLNLRPRHRVAGRNARLGEPLGQIPVVIVHTAAE